jgi:glucose/arabinose dehydrogenase
LQPDLLLNQSFGLGANMHVTRRVIFACSTSLFLVACSKGEQAAKDTTPPAAAAAPAPPPAATMADFAGKWDVVATPTSGKDTSVTKYVLTVADTNWTLAFPSGLKVPMHATLSGDSVMFKTDEFSSQRRKGVKVWTEGSSRIQGGKMVGMTTAHYKGAGADSVLTLKIEGNKAP